MSREEPTRIKCVAELACVRVNSLLGEATTHNRGITALTAPDKTNLPVMLAEFMKQHGLSVRRVASAIACSEATLNRLLNGSTLATDEMLRQGKLLIQLGFDRYSTLTTAERENLLDKVSAVGGGAAGVGIVAVAGAGASGAGMAAGLAAAGSVIGGGMAAGIVVAAAIPLACAGLGYGIFRAVKYFVSESQLDDDALAPKWETPRNLAQ